MPKITLYVLKGESGKRYVGITNNLARKLFDLRQGRSKGGPVMGKFGVLLTESFTDQATAQQREKFLKSGQGRDWLDEYERKPANRKG